MESFACAIVLLRNQVVKLLPRITSVELEGGGALGRKQQPELLLGLTLALAARVNERLTITGLPGRFAAQDTNTFGADVE